MTTMRKPAKPGTRRKSQQKGAQWERFVSEQWLKRLKAAGVLTAFHKLEPTKIGERFVKDAGADFVCSAESVTAARLGAWKMSTWMGVRECLRLEIADGK